jgi:hypothetical protein
VYEGRIQALDLVSMRVASNALRAAFTAPDPISELVVAPPVARGGVSWGYFVRPLGLDLDDVQEFGPTRLPTGYQRTFTASVRQADPRFYVSGVVSATSAGGATPISVTNSGNAPAEPQFQIYAPFTADVWLQRTGPDPRSLALAKEVIDPVGAGSIFVDFAARMITCPEQPGSDYSGAVLFQSDWWNDGVMGLLPGAQSIRVTECASWRIDYRHASY